MDQAALNLNLARQNANQAQDKLTTILDLIGDQYGVNLLDGSHQINQAGEIVPREDATNEGTKTEKQLLQE